MLTFSEEDHRYFWDGAPVEYSVTGVLSPLYDFEGIPDYVLENARNRGEAVHKAAELEDQSRLDWSRLHPEVEPYVQAWVKFKKETGFIPELIEHRVYNHKHRFAGTLDRTGILFGEHGLLDVKATAKISKVTALQTAAYASCFDEPLRRFCIQLKRDGNYDLVEYKERGDFNKFITVLNYQRIKGEFNGNN